MYVPKFISKGTHRQMLACFPILFNQLLVGVGWGWTAPTMMKLQGVDSPLPLTAQQVSWIVSIHEVGRLVSPFMSPLIVDNIGRRYSMFLVTFMTFLIWLSQIFIRNNLLLIMVRLAFGMVNGLQDVVSPIYITENCSATLRKINGGLISIIFSVGKCMEIILATYLTYEMTAVVNTVISICAFGTLYFCVETPQFLIMKGRESEAENNLKWLHGNSEVDELSKQFEELKDYVRKEKEKKKSIRTLLSSAENVKGLLIVLSVYLISTATGGGAIGPYIGIILVPTETFTPNHLLFLSEILGFVALLTSPFFNARIETRKLMIVCYLGASFFQFGTSVLMFFHNRNHEIAFYPWLIFITITSYGLIRAPIGPTQYILRGELLPLSVRSLGGSMSIVITAAMGFCVIKAFLPTIEYFGMEMNFLIYAFVCLSMCITIYCCLPKAPDESVTLEMNDLEKTATKLNKI